MYSLQYPPRHIHYRIKRKPSVNSADGLIIFSLYRLLLLSRYSSAMDGNEKAIEKLLAFYDPYISKCCLRSLYDEYGNVYIVVDMELKGRIREALIKMILGFDIEDMDLEPEE